MEGENSLDNILIGTQFAGINPTVLSIDIDSDDLKIWQFENEVTIRKSLSNYHITKLPN